MHERYPGKENEILRNTNPAINGEILLSGSIENDHSNDYMLSGGKSPGDLPPLKMEKQQSELVRLGSIYKKEQADDVSVKSIRKEYMNSLKKNSISETR